jgi:putative Mn2+ efflux pump MntP
LCSSWWNVFRQQEESQLHPLEIFLVALALGCDAFAVGLGVGARCGAPRQVFRLSFHFGLFQFLMPLIGWLLGQNMLGIVRQSGPWIATALLLFIGGKMIYEGIKAHEEEGACPDPTRGFSLVALSVATSLDALGVGFSLGVIGVSLIFPALWIGITAGAMTWTAMKVGNRLSERFGRRMDIAGGIILILIGFRLLIM